MSKKIHLLFISGSLRNGSAHHALLQYLRDTNPEFSIVIYDGIEAIPNFNPEKDAEPFPNAVVNFRNAVAKTDAILICTPEYAYGIPGALKNALDWTVSSGDFVDKPVGIITASGLGEHAHASLLLVLTALNSTIIEGATLHIPWFKSKMDKDNKITDKQTELDLQSVVKELVKSVSQL